MTTNNFKPILFSTEMVQAILAGRKTQTRRFVKPQPEYFPYTDSIEGHEKSLKTYINVGLSHGAITAKFQIGDILWVRESFQYSDDLDEPYWYKQKYKEDFLPEYFEMQKWKPSIHMPKEAARIFLKVTNVRCERLQDILEEDAIAEGCKPVKRYSTRKVIYQDHSYYTKNPRSENGCFDTAKKSFESLWDSINAKKQPWRSNPWVWVYDFERIEKPENFI